MERTEFVIYEEQDEWLRNLSKKTGKGEQFLGRRAVMYYKKIVWERDGDDAIELAEKRGYYGQLKSEKSERKHVRLPEDEMEWIRETAEEYGVAMSYLFRRTLTKYRNEVVEGTEWTDPFLEGEM